MKECIYCKSAEIEKDLPIVARETVSSPVMVGPYFLLETKKFLGRPQHHCKVERMYADICKQCGVKLHVKNTNNDWQKEISPAGVIWHT